MDVPSGPSHADSVNQSEHDLAAHDQEHERRTVHQNHQNCLATERYRQPMQMSDDSQNGCRHDQRGADAEERGNRSKKRGWTFDVRESVDGQDEQEQGRVERDEKEGDEAEPDVSGERLAAWSLALEPPLRLTVAARVGGSITLDFAPLRRALPIESATMLDGLQRLYAPVGDTYQQFRAVPLLNVRGGQKKVRSLADLPSRA